MQSSILYLQRLRQLLQMEHDNEREEFRVWSEQIGLSRKIRRGICWYPVSVGRSYYNSLNQFVVEIERKHDDENDEAESLFEYGKPVQFFSFNLKDDFFPLSYTAGKRNSKEKDEVKYFAFNSFVSFVEEDRMVVTLPSSQALIDLQNTKHLGVQLYFDETSYRTMFHALDDVIAAKGNRLAELREICAGQLKPKFRACSPMSFPWLNKTQEAAVNMALAAKDVMIVHGPPGTGKTTTLVETIYETLRRETQVMVCAQSNMAVDWISEKLVDHGVSVLRIGNPTRVNDKMLSFTYERKFESHPDYPELWNIRKTVRQLYETKNKGESTHQKISRLKDRAQELEMRINADLFNEARVIACTLVGSASKILVRHNFSTLFIDEAAQALEPACWIAMRRCSRVILAGDHQQLPPTIKCYEAMREGLGKTLMERIVENQPSAVSLLKVQYRMNDVIMRFSSDWFYHGEVKSDPSVHGRSILDFENPMMWVDGREETLSQPSDESEGMAEAENSDAIPENKIPDSMGEEQVESFREAYVGENHGRINKAEAELVISTLIDYINKIGRERFLEERLDIGVISPYKVQSQYLRQQVKRREELRLFRKLITVNTVDGFQGQERDIIMISLVRSNDEGQIGFLNDLRRMNVAMTRARMKLIIFGDKETLRHHKFYRKLIGYVEATEQSHEP